MSGVYQAYLNSIPLSQKGNVNGVATLDSTGAVPGSQLGNATGLYLTRTPDYDSGNVAIASASQAFAHGLAKLPSFFAVYLVCVTANLGYSPGDMIPIGTTGGGLSGASREVTAAADVTNITLSNCAYTNGLSIVEKTSATLAAIANGDWNYRVMAWI